MVRICVCAAFILFCGLSLAACGEKDKVGQDIVDAGDQSQTPDDCVPYCGEEDEAECGDDGCGGTCGECEPGAVCGEADYDDIGICFNATEQCPGICGDAECGQVWNGLWEPDNCDCGTCPAGMECSEEFGEDGFCIDSDCMGEGCPPDKCWPGLVGEHGLGALCNENGDCDTGFCAILDDGDPFCTYLCQECCPTAHSCAQVPVDSPDVFFACLPDCVPDCGEPGQCGDDGCVGQCDCLPGADCLERDYDPEVGPGGVCFDPAVDCLGACEEGACGDVTAIITADGLAICDCGPCPGGQVCVDEEGGGVCCTPLCEGKDCGDDGCGGSCGECSLECPMAQVCQAGKCVDGCSPQCAGKECGDDGCGCPCGECAADQMCLGGECTPALAAEPVLTLSSLQEPVCGGSVTVKLWVEGWDQTAGDAAANCFFDGVLAGSTSEPTFDVDALATGMHSVCCTLTWKGEPLAQCDATGCLELKVACPCTGAEDDTCDDSNPCSVDACMAVGGDAWKCHYGITLDSPACCVSDLDCPCEDGLWAECDEVTSTCLQ